MRIIHCEQGTPEWCEARTGRATASKFDRILTPTGKPSAQREDYACELIGERLLTGPDPWRTDYQSPDMLRGSFTEAEARRFVAFELDADVEQVGFCVHDNDFWGCSPDGLIGEDGGLELKCPKPATQVRYFLDGVLPPKYAPQVHGSLIVTGRANWWFCSYCPGLPPLLLKVVPDVYTEQLRTALVEFTELFATLLGRVESAREAAIDAAIARKQEQTPVTHRSFV